MEYAAGLSGATLGYINNNFRGAIKGYYLGKKLYQTMAPTPGYYTASTFAGTDYRSNKRKRLADYPRRVSVPATLAYRSRARQLRFARSLVRASRKMRSRIARRRRRKHTRRGMTAPVTSVVNTENALVWKKKKGISLPKFRPARVSRKFKQKVHKSLEDKPYGFYQKIHMNGVNFQGLTGVNNYQIVADLRLFFNPAQFIEAASVLFNNMTPVEYPGFTETGMITPIQHLNMYVKNSWVTFEIKNNSERSLNLKFFECKPQSNVRLAEYDSIPQEWLRQLQAMNQGLTGINNNPQAVVPGTMHADPRSCPGLMRKFKMHCAYVNLMPGQVHKFTCQGPSNFNLNMLHYLDNTSTNDTAVKDYYLATKFSRAYMLIAEPDLVSAGAGATLRFGRFLPDPTVATQHTDCLIYEVNEYFNIECPDLAGFLTGSTPQTLNLKRDVYVVKDFTPADVAGNDIHETTENNPPDSEMN